MPGKHGTSVEDGAFDGYRMYLRNERIRCGMTQKDLAGRIGVTREALCQYEKGIREPSYGIMSKIAKELGVQSMDKLYEKYTYHDGLFMSDSGRKELGIA